jgi:NADH-quinone oxidoreductase subunit C
MTPVFESLTNKLKERFGVAVESIYEFRDEVTLSVKKEIIDEVCRFLHDNTEWRFDICEDVTAIDWYEPVNRFEVVYHLFCLKHKIRIVLKAKVDERDCVVPTISSVYTGANWQEREVYDMFGIEFSDHPDLRRIYMPEDYEYFPLRKDFPLMGIPGSIPLPQR